MNLYIVRHGYTNENEKGTYYGALDPKLNLKGINQCKGIRSFLNNVKFSKVYTSSKKRAKETANLITECDITLQDERLNERNFGVFEGKDYKELMRDYKDQYNNWQKDWINYSIPEGESHKDFSLRIYEFVDEILMSNSDSDNLLLVTHAGVMRVIYTYVMDKDINLFWKFASHNGDVAIIKYEYGNLFIDSINQFKE